MIECRHFCESSTQIQSGVVSFSGGNIRRRESRKCRGIRAFADDDPCAQAILDLQIQRIVAVYDLRFKCSFIRESKVAYRLPVHELSAGRHNPWIRRQVRR